MGGQGIEAVREEIRKQRTAFQTKLSAALKGDAAKAFDYDALRSRFPGVWMINNGYSRGDAMKAVASGKGDLIAFGRPFISNPDLVRRLREDAPFNELRADKLYGGGQEGYTDYPTLDVETVA